MKSRFTTIDIVATLTELQSLLGMRVINVYDIDNKTYLFKLSSKEAKAMLLMESGIRLHTTDFEWPKSPAPSGFTMKLRKHILNRRLESAAQIGVDRIVDLQFGSGEAAYHVILELYDKGNIVLTDYQYSILNILRPRVEGEDVKYMVRNIYPIEKAKQPESIITSEWLREILMKAKVGDNLRRVLNPHLIYGPALIDHVLLEAGFCDNAKIGKGFSICEDIPRLLAALDEAEKIMISARSDNTKGYIIQKKEKRAGGKDEANDLLVYNEFHPYMFRQHEKLPYIELSSFCKASDEFFSKLESQKIDMKAVQQEKDALKKLENVKKDHERRIDMLEKVQEEDKHKAELIEMNLELVDRAILVIQSAIANQISWKEIDALIQEAQAQGDPVARTIKKLKLEINHITLLLSDPYFSYDSDNEDDAENVAMLIDIDLDLSAYANAKKYYDQKRHAAKKEQKTLDSSTKAYKSAERKTKQVLKDVAIVTNIKKARKVHWFEKFFWFISSENYLIIGGRDQQQNELIVKRYLRAGDIYVHADLHGASSIVVKNPTGLPIPPKTLNEAGTMAVCYSSAWDAKVVTSAWWVYQDQVSKTAPTGEYLTTGSFMIRGRKNYLPPCHLIMGFGILFKLDDESVTKHKDERRIKTTEDDGSDADALSLMVENNDVDISLHSSGDDSVNEEKTVLPVEEAHLKMVNDLESSEANKQNNNSQKINSESEEEIASNPEDDEDNKFSSAYPDTVVELEHVQGEQFLMRHRSISTTSGISDVSQEVQENTVVFLGDNTPVIVGETTSKSIPLKCSNKGSQHKNVNKPPTKHQKTEQLQEKLSLSKRGQKYKLRKMKEKYKDQDDEDRQLALELLQPAGASKEPKNKKGKMKKDGSKPTVSANKSKQIPSRKLMPDLTHIIAGQDQNRLLEANLTNTGHNAEPDEAQVSDEEKEKLLSKEDELLLSSLTGIPFADDVLLYAVPVCGPYNSMINYKYKVKLTPGTGKRGKAAKTAIAMHLHDKSATGRERDLIKSLKDQDVSRNIPGKVKMSAPQLQKLKHR